MDEGYQRLYQAIFKQAVQDDINLITKMTMEELRNRCVGTVTAVKILKENKQLIEDRVKECVAREAIEYPGYTPTRAQTNRKVIANEVVRLALE